MCLFRVSAVLLAAWAGSATGEFSASDIPRCVALELPVAYVEGPPPQYLAFCDKEEGACRLEGDAVLPWTETLHRQLSAVNRAVNTEITVVPDQESAGKPDVWSLPRDSVGDCEDFALEKRRRLVAQGLPGASLTCAIVFHQVRLFPHAVLLAETSKGTWVLDQLYDDVLCWDAVPYTYTARERPDGQWTRFALP